MIFSSSCKYWKLVNHFNIIMRWQKLTCFPTQASKKLMRGLCDSTYDVNDLGTQVQVLNRHLTFVSKRQCNMTPASLYHSWQVSLVSLQSLSDWEISPWSVRTQAPTEVASFISDELKGSLQFHSESLIIWILTECLIKICIGPV